MKIVVKCLHCSEEITVDQADCEETMVKEIVRVHCPHDDDRDPPRLALLAGYARPPAERYAPGDYPDPLPHLGTEVSHEPVR